MSEKGANPRDPDPTQVALEAASRALAAANAAVQAAFKALAKNSSRRAAASRKVATKAHPPARARAKKPATPEPTLGPPAPVPENLAAGPLVADAPTSAPVADAPPAMEPGVEELPPPMLEDAVIPPPVVEAAAPRPEELEVTLHEAELQAREQELEAREAAMALYAPMEPPRRIAARPQADDNGFTVLVVDDEEQVRALTVRILSRYGYRVLQASGVEIALNLLDEPTASVDVVLSDVAMPGLSGKDLFRAISESRPGLPVVFMSGYALGVYAPEGLVEEGVKMLPKPFTQEDLLGFVTEALEGAAAR